MPEENKEGLVFNGCSTVDGNTTGGKHSHLKGMNRDVRCLNKNKNGETTWLFVSTTDINSHFNYERQVKSNNDFYKRLFLIKRRFAWW